MTRRPYRGERRIDPYPLTREALARLPGTYDQALEVLAGRRQARLGRLRLRHHAPPAGGARHVSVSAGGGRRSGVAHVVVVVLHADGRVEHPSGPPERLAPPA